MILDCPSCHARYLAPEESFGRGARKVACARCGHQWTASVADHAMRDLPGAAAAQAAPAAQMAQATPATLTTLSDLSEGVTADQRVWTPSPAPDDRRNSGGMGFMWVLLLAPMVGAAGFVVAWWRESLIAFWPPLRRLYAMLDALFM